MNPSILLSYIRTFGSYVYLVIDIFKDLCTRGVSLREFLKQFVKIGVNSIPIVLITSLFTGMVLALQTAYGLERFGAKNYVGNITGLGFLRELGPVLTSVVVCGRVAAGVAAEVSSMVVTEQVDALRALGANPISKLVTPKVLAATIATPLLVILADVVGIYGALVVAVLELNVSAYIFYRSLLYTLVIRDFVDGLIKSAVFGFLVVSVACFKGLRTSGGTEGVGQTTTSAVVIGSLIIFVVDFLLTKLLMII